MTKTTLMLCAALALSACATISESRFNPLNWFGSSTSAPLTAPTNVPATLIPAGESGPVDGRGLIDQIIEMRVDRTPTGAIVRATGLATTQGQFNAQLVPTGFDSGTLILSFRIEGVQGAQVGTPRSRQVTAARALDFDQLAGVRGIQVRGVRNARVSSR